jgi:hypothetical protein
VNLDKITNPHDWGFFFYFDRFLLKSLYPINKAATREVKVDPSNFQPRALKDQSDEIQKAINSHVAVKTTTLGCQVIEDRLEHQYEDFVASLTGLHQQTLEAYQSLEKRKSALSVARMLNRPRDEVDYDLLCIKAQAMEFFGVRELV